MTIRRLALVALALTICTLTLDAQGRRGPNWVLLGQRAVTDRADHDTIMVTAAKGTFRAVKFEVLGHAVDCHRVVIHFGNGGDQKVELRNTIPAGGSSRDIDIDGTNRVIRSIDFWWPRAFRPGEPRSRSAAAGSAGSRARRGCSRCGAPS